MCTVGLVGSLFRISSVDNSFQPMARIKTEVKVENESADM